MDETVAKKAEKYLTDSLEADFVLLVKTPCGKYVDAILSNMDSESEVRAAIESTAQHLHASGFAEEHSRAGSVDIETQKQMFTLNAAANVLKHSFIGRYAVITERVTEEADKYTGVQVQFATNCESETEFVHFLRVIAAAEQQRVKDQNASAAPPGTPVH
ncbi:MAG: hypothetical protein AAGI44_03045 [Pseudomonadota bacterium]